MAEKEGWIKTYRKIQDCWIWRIDKPFDERSAWIDLLLSANHTAVKTPFNGELITVKRSQYLTSVRKLSDKWKWNKDKTLKFLRLLESDGMIKRDSDRYRTLITIENYDIYQDKKDTERTGQGTGQGTRNGHEPATNKNVKNVKNNNINNRAKNFIPPSVDEVRAYCSERNNKVDAQSFVDFYESKGWFVGKNKMKDWKAAVRTWERSNNTTSKITKNSFNSIPQRSYEFDELERKLLSKNK